MIQKIVTIFLINNIDACGKLMLFECWYKIPKFASKDVIAFENFFNSARSQLPLNISLLDKFQRERDSHDEQISISFYNFLKSSMRYCALSIDIISRW